MRNRWMNTYMLVSDEYIRIHSFELLCSFETGSTETVINTIFFRKALKWVSAMLYKRIINLIEFANDFHIWFVLCS